MESGWELFAAYLYRARTPEVAILIMKSVEFEVLDFTPLKPNVFDLTVDENAEASS